MNHEDAAEAREQLHDLACVEDPADDDMDATFTFALVHQPGYANGKPYYEVLLKPSPGVESVHLPGELLDWLGGHGYTVRVDQDDLTVHIRDGL